MGIALATCLCLLALPQQKTATRTQFDEYLLRQAGAGWSGAALVAQGGEVRLAKGYGFADFESKRANTERTLFEIASLTKSFTAVAVAKLAQVGRLELDEPLGAHLPSVPKHSRALTVRQLLGHTSGIPRANARGRGDDLALAVSDYLGAGPQEKPGTRFEYWNGGYALLAGVIERASERGYTQYLEEELFAPAGMSDTGFTGDADLDAARAALGSSSDGRARSALEHPYGDYGYQYRGMGGIVTTVLDLAKWDRALAKNAVLDAAHTQELFTPGLGGYALGWYVGKAFDGTPRQSHGGSVRGFVSDFRRLPAHDACIAVLANGDDAKVWELGDDLECLLLGRSLEHPAPDVEPLAWKDAQSCAGDYACAKGKLHLGAAEGVLWAGIEGQELLDALGAAGKLGWKADREELGQIAVEIIEGIARGNSEPLRTHMAKRISASWPDRMRRSIWPAHLKEHGKLLGARPLGAVARQERLQILLALEHETSPARVLIDFGPAGLERLEWKGPQFVLSARLELVRDGVFDLLTGDDPPRLEFERAEPLAKSLKVKGLKLVRE
ncbi:MAG: class A beta-lactamase-related serine hydrolase [Planctomycetes bacterium]|nr:class A beta-lactamase-related serine hydrolase [Planctomycetota bacterium]